MSEHLSSITLTALADGELAGEDLSRANLHLAQCDLCTRRALNESLLNRAAERAGHKYALPETFQERVIGSLSASHIQSVRPEHLSETGEAAALHDVRTPRAAIHNGIARYRTAPGRFASSRWPVAMAAAALLCISVFFAYDMSLHSAVQTALLSEAVDEHIAAMAAGTPEVISSDRHTVKPWFQGRLPFSFNLPQVLPQDITLDGANLVQVAGQPAAQLLFSIGKHHASVFLWQHSAMAPPDAERTGFHALGFRSHELDAVAVSDADPARLRELAQAMAAAQQ